MLYTFYLLLKAQLQSLTYKFSSNFAPTESLQSVRDVDTWH